jgi:hypothetical protein
MESVTAPVGLAVGRPDLAVEFGPARERVAS